MIKKILINAFIAFFLVALLFSNTNRPEAEFDGSITIEIVYEDYSATYEDYLVVETIQFKQGDTLFFILESNFEFNYKHYVGIGNMITQVDDLKEGNNKYIVFFINDEFSTTGVDDTLLVDGMIIRFELW